MVLAGLSPAGGAAGGRLLCAELGLPGSRAHQSPRPALPALPGPHRARPRGRGAACAVGMGARGRAGTPRTGSTQHAGLRGSTDTAARAAPPTSDQGPQTCAAPALLGLGSVQIPSPGAIRRSALRLLRASTPHVRTPVLSQGCRCAGAAGTAGAGPRPEKAPAHSPPAFSLPVPSFHPLQPRPAGARQPFLGFIPASCPSSPAGRGWGCLGLLPLPARSRRPGATARTRHHTGPRLSPPAPTAPWDPRAHHQHPPAQPSIPHPVCWSMRCSCSTHHPAAPLLWWGGSTGL